MLDDMATLRDAVEAYRAAATAAGLAWPDGAVSDGPSCDVVRRVFDVDHVAEQLTWLGSQGWQLEPLLPFGGRIMPWPTPGGDALDYLSLSTAAPFPWRHQMPLFFFEITVYTFVLAGDREGEIWRYEIDPDFMGPVRAAPSLAALFTEWTRGIAAGVLFHDEGKGWLDPGDDVQDLFVLIEERALDLDPFAFPEYVSDEPLLRARQRECGVDMGRVGPDHQWSDELARAVSAAKAAL